MVIHSSTRRILAALSTAGFAAGVLAYALSFLGVVADHVVVWHSLLFIGAILLGLPIQILESPRSWRPFFSFKKLAQGMPAWIVTCNLALLVFVLAQIAWLVFHGGELGVTAVRDGQYVLEDHGNVIKVLSKAEYLSINEAMSREASTLILSAYYIPMTYWWFWRNGKPVD